MDPKNKEADIDEKHIDSLKLPQAIKTAKQHNINLGKLKTLEDVRCVLKRHLLKDKLSRSSVIDGLTISAEKDATQRKYLFDIFKVVVEATHCLIKKEDPLIEKLNKSFPDFQQLLIKQKAKLEGKTSKCPILVLGETGAGKSSFINLLLGQDILPCSLLSNTNVICEIMYHDDTFAIIYPRDVDKNSEKILLSPERGMKEFIEELSKKIQKTEEKDSQQAVYKKAEIYLPQDILKTGIVIVDSPGIGDTEEMTNMVLDYIMEACAFIYVINSANAGGVQTDRLQDLLQKVYEKAFQDHKDYRPECALFICNKWDQVPYNEREDVYNDTVEKLRGRASGWPDCKSDQIITLSTREASFIQKDGFIVGQFYKIVLEINRLVPLSREILILNSFRLLFQFLKKALFCIETNIKDATLSPEEREKLAKDTVDSLRQLKKEVRDFFEDQKKYLSGELSVVAKKMSKHLQQNKIMEVICNFKEGSLNSKDWKEMMIIVRSQVYDRLSRQIQDWENSNREFEKIGNQIASEFKEKFPDFDDKLSQLENKFGRSGRENESPFDEDDVFEGSFVPLNVKQSFGSLSLGLKVLVGVSLSPVFLLGAIVRLPVWGLKELKRIFDSHWLEKTYNKDENLAIRKYAELTVKAMVDPFHLVPLMENELVPLFLYLDQQKNKVLRQIDVEMMLIETKEDKLHHCENTIAKYDPIYRQFVKFQDKTKVFKLGYFERPEIEIPTSCIEIDKTDAGVISDGILATVMKAVSLDIEKTKSYREIAVRKSKIELDEYEVGNYLQEEHAYRGIKKPHIVQTVGLIKDNKLQLQQLLTPLMCNLRHALQQGIMGTRDINWEKECFIVMEQVVQGLAFLNDRKYVHHDLSLDTVMIDAERRVKLASIQKPKTVSEVFFPLETKDILKYVHIRYDILLEPGSVLYDHKHDMYSVGIMMWEIFYNDKAYQKQIKSSSNEIETLRDFAEYLKKGNKLCNSVQTPAVSESWCEITNKCLGFEIEANDWLKWQTPVYRNYDRSLSGGHESMDSAMVYCMIK